MNLVFEGHGLKKVFNRRPIFSDVELRVRAGEVLVVTGKNGSGKSTLVKILARVLTPTAGGLRLTSDGNSVKEDLWPYHVGLVSPYLQLFEEFSTRENLELAFQLRGLVTDVGRIDALLGLIGLAKRANDPVRTFSSGMKQRVKYAVALAHAPALLL